MNYLGGYGGYGANGWGMMGFGGGLLMLLFWALVILGIAALVKWLMNQSNQSGGTHDSAMEILKERYAKGEIDRKEFEEKKKDLVH